jgi:hypothetical protein
MLKPDATLFPGLNNNAEHLERKEINIYNNFFLSS